MNWKGEWINLKEDEVEETFNGNDLAVKFELCYYNNKSVKVMTFTSNQEKEVCNF